MAKQTKSFTIEIKTSRRTRPLEKPTSIWGKFGSDLKKKLAEEQETSVPPTVDEHCPIEPDLEPVAVVDHDEASELSSSFLQKWVTKKAEKPKAGAVDATSKFLERIERQKTLLAALRFDPAGFTNWRSAWFRQVAGGYGISIGHDSVDAGGGLKYVVVDTLDAVAEFLEDLAHHTQTDMDFQRALTESRRRRAKRLLGAKAE